MATTMATTTTVVGGACARRTPHGGGARVAFARQSRLAHTTRTRARIDSKDPWWEKPCPENMKECESTMEFLNLLNEHADALVVVDVYARWCGACRALYPKLSKIAKEYPDVIFVKVNFDANKELCRSLGVKVLPYFKFYRGNEGCVAQFSASIAKIKLLRSALVEHSAARCDVDKSTPAVHYDDLEDLKELEALSEDEKKEAEPTPVST